MEAGSELDALVAEKVMEYVVGNDPLFGGRGPKIVSGPHWITCDGKEPTWQRENEWPITCPKYSTDISAAWAVVEKLQKDDFMVKLWSPNQDVDKGTYAGMKKGDWECTVWKWFDRVTGRIVPPFADAIDPYGEIISMKRAETAPAAICLAALKAVGVNLEGKE